MAYSTDETGGIDRMNSSILFKLNGRPCAVVAARHRASPARSMMMAYSAMALLALPASSAAAAAQGPCDILVAAGNPCVAAHSTVRALYSGYSGPLYRVSRTDGHDADVGALEAGGFANISAQEGFCSAGDCNISKIYDQSGKGNHLTQRISCVPGQGCVYHKMVNASRHKIGVQGGGEVYVRMRPPFVSLPRLSAKREKISPTVRECGWIRATATTWTSRTG